jgi:outer membrane protein assembly factor BamD
MKPMQTVVLPLSILLLLGGATGCRKAKTIKSTSTEYDGRTAKDLVALGELYLQNGRWDEGRKVLRVIEEQLPSAAEFPRAKLLIADSFFFGSTTSYPEALVEYKSFLNYYPRDEMRDYALYRVALCHYASIESAERDQTETRKALDCFQDLIKQSPGSVYAVDAKTKVTQCWLRLAESELLVGIFYVKTRHYAGAEKRIKDLLETYPEYADRERAYFFLGEAMRQKFPGQDLMRQWQKDFVAKAGKENFDELNSEQRAAFNQLVVDNIRSERDHYLTEAKGYYKKLVESYPGSEWAAKASDRLVDMGQAGLKEELDS